MQQKVMYTRAHETPLLQDLENKATELMGKLMSR